MGHTNKKFKKAELTTKEKWKYWLNSWRWSSIKATWNFEYARTINQANNTFNKIGGNR